ncbi:uncharacterized protein TA17575 [Theileria annulata]|uniref:SfiI-subtelomeric related protein family member n=1 Tax=Theileria annulata TaxID=5874 RepID=Q4UBL5_THEAN|nr:uncharacterized protein TA17575 [Theileria annulata]CAI75786.1 hypothetical protein TA17575 [Theileria annulata]|eukprot:XP_955262.1 hypothetical protein TA17575 [Theileria annulata]
MKLLSLTLSIILGVNWAICTLSGYKNDVMCGCEETCNTHQKPTESDIKVYTLDSNDKREENNTTKYNFEKYFYGFVLRLNDVVKSVEIKFKDKTMWVYDENKNIYPVKAYFDTSQTLCLLEFKDLYYSYNLCGSTTKLLNYLNLFLRELESQINQSLNCLIMATIMYLKLIPMINVV